MDQPPEKELVIAAVDWRAYVFPVIAMVRDEGDQLAQPPVFGTAFCVGPGIFVTAGHVISNALAVGKPALAVAIDEKQFRHARAVMHEIVEGYDVGVMACKAQALGLLNWADGPVSMGHDVRAIGFPYSVDFDNELDAWKLGTRTFKGYVITRRRIWRFAAKPVGYEVDCPFYPGLSGAPLLDSTGPVPEMKLIGMVLGEQRTKFAGRRICFGEALDVVSLSEVPSVVAGTMLARIGAQPTPAPATLGKLRDSRLGAASANGWSFRRRLRTPLRAVEARHHSDWCGLESVTCHPVEPNASTVNADRACASSFSACVPRKACHRRNAPSTQRRSSRPHECAATPRRSTRVPLVSVQDDGGQFTHMASWIPSPRSAQHAPGNGNVEAPTTAAERCRE